MSLKLQTHCDYSAQIWGSYDKILPPPAPPGRKTCLGFYKLKWYSECLLQQFGPKYIVKVRMGERNSMFQPGKQVWRTWNHSFLILRLKQLILGVSWALLLTLPLLENHMMCWGGMWITVQANIFRKRWVLGCWTQGCWKPLTPWWRCYPSTAPQQPFGYVFTCPHSSCSKEKWDLLSFMVKRN